ncbi:MAG: glycosyltransferase family 4 protein [Candidatus Thermoplasmatota archaeon]
MSRPSSESKKIDLDILFVTESYPPDSYGGGEISCALLAQALVERNGVEVTVLTSKVEGEKDSEKKNGVKIIRRLRTGEDRSSLKNNLKRRALFKRSVKKELDEISHNYDLIHFFNITSITDVSTDKPTFATINSYINFCPKGNLFYKEESVCEGCSFTKFLGCITNSKYVGNQKLSGLLKYNPVFWAPLYLDYKKRNKSLKYVDHFFSLSEFINQQLIKAGIDAANITKVVNIPKIETSSRQIDLPDDAPIVSYIGALTKIKGVDLLIRAFEKVETEAELIIVGDGPERKKLGKMGGSNSNIMFLGKVEHEDISSIYERSDIVVVPSVWPEPLSRVLLEAAHFGTPILATDVGGSPEVIKDGYNGLLFKPEVEDLSMKLKEILEDEDKIQEMGRNMEKYYEENLSKSTVVDRILETYRSRL